MRVWTQDYYTEAHRTKDRQYTMYQAFKAVGVELVPTFRKDIDLVFCGSLFTAAKMRKAAFKCGKPTVYYNWDLYPHVVRNRPDMGWGFYLQDLSRCSVVVVPNHGTAQRTMEFVNKPSRVVHAPVQVWDPPVNMQPRVPPRTYALDVMRDYPWDAGWNYALDACRELGIPLVRTRTKMRWDAFRWTVANALVLISAVDEASTGGLTLLEGYAHNVPVIVSDSPLNGGGEYFENRALTFDHRRGHAGLMDELKNLLHNPYYLQGDDGCRKWVEETYSDAAFAANMKEVFQSCL